jgi:hypothetical protein
MLQREAAGNSLTVEPVRGRVVNTWPLVIAVDAHDGADVIIKEWD